MNAGKIAVIMLLGAAVLTGALVYYMQMFGYYDEVDQTLGTESLVVTTTDGNLQPLSVSDFHGIDKDSSPLGWRACFTLDAAPANAQPYPNPTPLVGPNWFRCYSARGITGDLESGAVRAVLSQHNIRTGIDRVIAIYPDGRAFGWHQLNDEAEEQRLIE
ncbi:MAG: DUF6446 family protein [Paracoccus sp. (in: a-proteobacteria)]|uniref:DUF6446 family protein n=1 Tax=Paracoccus sp. TaxID=267 RepID=UPI0026E07AD1|nr:DUF6446 family protein [Paracoccus sp. (in: a-proteobacteria)]MDO5614373.1 DUF6446 family protein [Paracoccus sp. (in: a-proteobacteria)]MDO5631579.1 DUF6446 family protein [Paracoccus sp. (in: a-proteobacteria)]